MKMELKLCCEDTEDELKIEAALRVEDFVSALKAIHSTARIEGTVGYERIKDLLRNMEIMHLVAP